MKVLQLENDVLRKRAETSKKSDNVVHHMQLRLSPHPKLILKNLASVEEAVHPGFVDVLRGITSALRRVNVTTKYVKVR